MKRLGIGQGCRKSRRCLYPRLTGEGIDELLRRIEKAIPIDPIVKFSLHMPLKEGRTLALIHALGRVVHSEVTETHMDLEVEVPENVAKRLKLNDFVLKETSRRSPSYR